MTRIHIESDQKEMEWAGEWETYHELTRALALLKETEVC